MTPPDLAACGCTATVRRPDTGRCINLERRICTDHTLRLNGRSRSYVSALFQLGETAGKVLDDMERTAKRESEEEGNELTA